MSRILKTTLFILALAFFPAIPSCLAEGGRSKTIEITAEADGHFVREIIVRSSEGDEPQIFYLQDGNDVSPGVIKLRSKVREGGFLGVHLIELGPELRSHFGVSGERGLMVSRIVDSSPAAHAEIEVGDILLRAGARNLDSIRVLREQIQAKESGESLALEILRDGQTLDLTANLADSVEHVEPQVLFELRTEEGPEGSDYRFGWHCEEVECPRLADEEILDASMVRLRELLESGELGSELQSQDPSLKIRIELLEHRLREITLEIEEQSEPD